MLQTVSVRNGRCCWRTDRAHRVPNSAGIVTTVKGVRDSIDAWCTYHLAIGFEHLFVYFDDPDESASVNLLARFSKDRVSPIPHDNQLRAAWRRDPVAAACLPRAFDAGNRVGSGLNLRQELNARHAMGLARSRRLTWLLHIDGDELFYPGQSGDARVHFAQLNAIGASVFCYMNHEGVPEVPHTTSPFLEVTLFKRNVDAIPRTAAARAAGAFWTDRIDSHSYFLYYDNGKSAARVGHDVRPLSPHEWLPSPAMPPPIADSKVLVAAAAAQVAPAVTYQRVFSNMTSRLPICHVRPGNRTAAEALAKCVMHVHSDAAVLHFPICGWRTLERRWRQGNLPPSLWRLFHTKRSSQVALTAASYPWKTHTTVLHDLQLLSAPSGSSTVNGCWYGSASRVASEADSVEGRPIVTSHPSSESHEEEARRILRQIYEERIILQDSVEAQRQIEAGVCMREYLPRNVLSRHGFSTS